MDSARNLHDVLLLTLFRYLQSRSGEYRKEKNWEMSDKIRDELKQAGVTLEDNPKRILWKLSEN